MAPLKTHLALLSHILCPVAAFAPGAGEAGELAFDYDTWDARTTARILMNIQTSEAFQSVVLKLF